MVLWFRKYMFLTCHFAFAISLKNLYDLNTSDKKLFLIVVKMSNFSFLLVTKQFYMLSRIGWSNLIIVINAHAC